MNGQPNRLPVDGDHRFKGAEIDRGKPLRFRLDGRLIHGFAGDSVLSAALASGVIGAGFKDGNPLALDERFAPLIRHRGRASRGAAALPMARTPAIEGLDLITAGPGAPGRLRRGWSRLLVGGAERRPGSLGLRYEGNGAIPPWLDATPDERQMADLVVIGGGVAGISAALAAATDGKRIVLVERRQSLGGNAGFFGATGEEEAPEAIIEQLRAAVAANPAITVLPRAEAFGLAGDVIDVHQVTVIDGVPVGKVLAIETPRIVIATGAIERLPIFSGNRLPGVVGALDAYDRAFRFGIWIGRQTLIATSTSIAYRLAAQVKGRGIAVDRVADSRINPQSRFVEISKAYGVAQLQGARPVSAALTHRRGGRLRVILGTPAESGITPLPQQHLVDQLTVSGGWQPELTLWHMAGGASRWAGGRNALIADGTLPGIELAGSVAGFETIEGCRNSGRVAAAGLFCHTGEKLDEQRISAIHETPDDATPLGPAVGPIDGIAYLDGGHSLITRPQAAPATRRSRRRRHASPVQALGVADVAAAVQLGIIGGDEAGAIARERCVTPGNIAHRAQLRPAAGLQLARVIPAYLDGRFGAAARVLRLRAEDGRRLETGCLVYRSADETDPHAAIGTIVGPAAPRQEGSLALLGEAAESTAFWVRDVSGAVAARLVKDEAGESPEPRPAKNAAASREAGVSA